jgi:alanine dehydrogenase
MLPRIKVDASQRSGFLKILPASLSEAGFAGIHAYTGGGKGDFLKVILLYEIESGNLVAVVESDRIGWLVPGAVSAVAARHLARKDSRTMCIFGSGRQARSQVPAVSSVCDLKLVKVYSPHKEHVDAYCAEMRDALGLNVVPAASPDEAVAEADIIAVTTNARAPVFDGNKIAPGTHINAIGAHHPTRREVDGVCVQRSKVVVDSLERAFQEEGALIMAMEEGFIQPGHIYGELGDVVAGKKQGRTDDKDITLFFSGATAVEYVAVAAEVYKRAMEQGMGQPLHLKKDEEVPRSLYVKKR